MLALKLKQQPRGNTTNRKTTTLREELSRASARANNTDEHDQKLHELGKTLWRVTTNSDRKPHVRSTSERRPNRTLVLEHPDITGERRSLTERRIRSGRRHHLLLRVQSTSATRRQLSELRFFVSLFANVHTTPPNRGLRGGLFEYVRDFQIQIM